MSTIPRMHAIARRALSLRPSRSLIASCRVVAGRRYPFKLRHLSSSALLRSQDDPANTDNPKPQPQTEDTSTDESEKATAGSEVPEAEEASLDPFQRPEEPHNGYGSAARRSGRNRRLKELPPVVIPEWFFRHNAFLPDEARQVGESLEILKGTITKPPQTTTEPQSEGQGTAHQDSLKAAPDCSDESQLTSLEVSPQDSKTTEPMQEQVIDRRYQLHQDIWNEILATIRTGLSLPNATYADAFPAAKSHVLLQSPKDGGIYFLDSVVAKAAAAIGADLIRLDAQDIAEIGGDYLGEGPEITPYTIRSLGYEAQHFVARQDSRATEEDADEEGEEFDDGEDTSSTTPRNNQSLFGIPVSSKINAIPIATLGGSLEDILKSGRLLASAFVPHLRRPDSSAPRLSDNQPFSDPWDDLKLGYVITALLESMHMKAAPPSANYFVPSNEDAIAATDSPVTEKTAVDHAIKKDPLIIHIRDYKEIQATRHGTHVLNKIHHHVRNKRKAGMEVLIVGTVSSADLMPSMSRSGFRTLQAEHEAGPGRTIVVTPPHTTSQDSVFSEDERRRMREINMRHLQDMIRRRSPDSSKTSTLLSQTHLRLDSSLEYSSGLEEFVWSFDRVHRVAVTALGLMGPEDQLTPEIIGKALQLLNSSDEVKFQWATEETEQQMSQHEGQVGRKSPLKAPLGSNSEEKMKKVRKNCNAHEKKLLGGVINPENIHTTFANVHAPNETIDALKNLTTLSLIRPEAFSYGVLATDNIPGLLLYGPPGTGKTLLAKAVAKESGATVLEVSGSEVYDMYVGEGEKNVKAIFTLAKKLSPCVVFIDEADAIFGSRSGHANRTSHRELINQFLREWDGMDDSSAFIMVATNRPFDLDDAVLRRLPRRLLVDLPVEKDREAILRIHLQGETLDSSVSLPELAAQTPFYSGSDLKNLSVAAAMACVREEMEEASRQPADAGPHKFPEKRTLAKRHFDKAMEEISASISEDMSSLAAIRKFDEKYGDRKGRRKRRTGWGFGSVADAQQAETGRVRN